MVAAGLCIALLDPFNASMWTGLNVVTRPFRPQLKYRYTMYYSADHIRSKLSREFSGLAQSATLKKCLYIKALNKLTYDIKIKHNAKKSLAMFE